MSFLYNQLQILAKVTPKQYNILQEYPVMIKQRSDDKGNTYTKIDEKYVKNQGEAIKNTSKMESLNNRANANNGDKNHDQGAVPNSHDNPMITSKFYVQFFQDKIKNQQFEYIDLTDQLILSEFVNYVQQMDLDTNNLVIMKILMQSYGLPVIVYMRNFYDKASSQSEASRQFVMQEKKLFSKLANLAKSASQISTRQQINEIEQISFVYKFGFPQGKCKKCEKQQMDQLFIKFVKQISKQNRKVRSAMNEIMVRKNKYQVMLQNKQYLTQSQQAEINYQQFRIRINQYRKFKQQNVEQASKYQKQMGFRFDYLMVKSLQKFIISQDQLQEYESQIKMVEVDDAQIQEHIKKQRQRFKQKQASKLRQLQNQRQKQLLKHKINQGVNNKTSNQKKQGSLTIKNPLKKQQINIQNSQLSQYSQSTSLDSSMQADFYNFADINKKQAAQFYLSSINEPNVLNFNIDKSSVGTYSKFVDGLQQQLNKMQKNSGSNGKIARLDNQSNHSQARNQMNNSQTSFDINSAVDNRSKINQIDQFYGSPASASNSSESSYNNYSPSPIKNRKPLCCRTYFFDEQPLAFQQSQRYSFMNSPFPFKKDKTQQIKKIICSFLNHEGGILFIGVIKQNGKYLAYGNQFSQAQKQEVWRTFRQICQSIQPDILTHKIYNVDFVPIRSMQKNNSFIPGEFVIKVVVKYGIRNQIYSYRSANSDYFPFRVHSEIIELQGRKLLQQLNFRFYNPLPLPVPQHPGPCEKPQIGQLINNYYADNAFAKKNSNNLNFNHYYDPNNYLNRQKDHERRTNNVNKSPQKGNKIKSQALFNTPKHIIPKNQNEKERIVYFSALQQQIQDQDKYDPPNTKKLNIGPHPLNILDYQPEKPRGYHSNQLNQQTNTNKTSKTIKQLKQVVYYVIGLEKKQIQPVLEKKGILGKIKITQPEYSKSSGLLLKSEDGQVSTKLCKILSKISERYAERKIQFFLLSLQIRVLNLRKTIEQLSKFKLAYKVYSETNKILKFQYFRDSLQAFIYLRQCKISPEFVN